MNFPYPWYAYVKLIDSQPTGPLVVELLPTYTQHLYGRMDFTVDVTLRQQIQGDIYG
jgi:hypothetical protein